MRKNGETKEFKSHVSIADLLFQVKLIHGGGPAIQ
jgi:hypothetical protein